MLGCAGSPGSRGVGHAGSDAQHAVGVREAIRVLGLQVLGLDDDHVEYNDGRLSESQRGKMDGVNFKTCSLLCLKNCQTSNEALFGLQFKI